MRKIEVKKKKGISVMVGYVLLITFGIIMGLIVFTYLKTYVPRDALQCDDGTSIFLKEYTCSGGELTITVKNNGRFNVAGYFIHAANSTNQTVATIDLSQDYNETSKINGNSIIFDLQNTNAMQPNVEMTGTFNINQLYTSIELIPIRYQGEGKDFKLVSCGAARIREEISCS
jgi:hypothetical protein